MNADLWCDARYGVVYASVRGVNTTVPSTMVFSQLNTGSVLVARSLALVLLSPSLAMMSLPSTLTVSYPLLQKA